MFNILIIGAGQIGSRHLQGLIGESLDLNITVVDTSSFSLDSAKVRWIEEGGDKSNHKIKWCEAISKNIKSLDLVIVATSSRGRAELVEQVALSVNVNYWVFEKVLAQSKQELDLIKYATNRAKGAWVNTPKRLMNWYKQLKIKFSNQKPLRIKKTGGLWGLACNSIHYIDLIIWWTGESLLSVNTSRLDPIWFKSKRAGYFEVSGELLINFSGGTELILQSYSNVVEDIMYIELADKKNWIIDESKGIAFESKKDILNGQLELQSRMTGPMVAKILTHGICELPTLKESFEQHTIFLDAMLNHWNLSNNYDDNIIPIT